MRTVCGDFTQAVGNTPLVHLRHISSATGVELLAKVESFNPLGSIKDRVAVAMVDDAEQRGLLAPGGTIVEPTSGNTGIGLAFVSASRGYHLILAMPESMSIERRKLLIHLGAELVLTPAAEGMRGAVARAAAIQQERPGVWMPNQFANPANPAMHRRTTGPEIWQQGGGRIDAFVAGVGTGGTISGVGGYLKEQHPAVRIVAVEPAASPVLSGGMPGPHKIQGIGAGFVPDNLDRAVIDEIVTVENDEAIRQAQFLARREGILCGISGGAALAGALRLAVRPEFQGKRIVLLLPDTGERYLSTELMTA
ncbi:cysteine synthase [Desulfobulbus propionicus DSM 2032]|uniref:cysteine synthase n=1 Tax=Desulfobulbus propionicus (strain ATCC 33891 / DSM 2032 / VKM B-1956 / 1pr3) TaxID=577650 RepID=A0A7U4DQK5_DESPD|nr:cysteine synthase A [Desulfobulbus propionicus]ADW19122.1 cysteine synthase [Desulfobulbus propionicus DSM 2032]